MSPCFHDNFLSSSIIEKLKKKWISSFGQTQKTVNSTIGCRSRRRVVVRVQVWVFRVRILCRVRISGRFGRFIPGFGLARQFPTLPPRHITRDCGELADFLAHIRISRKNWGLRVFVGPFGISCAELRFGFGLSEPNPMG